MSAPLVEARGVSRRFGRVRALRGLDLDLRRDECLLVVGPNGAGKSTLLRVLAGLVRPDAGRILLDEQPLGADPSRDRRLIGYVGHHTMLYDALSARENLAFAGRLHGVDGLRTRVDQLVRAMDLEARADDPVGELSRGLQQRVAVARALVHDPVLLLLDEPHAGLDVRASEILAELLRAVRRRGHAVVLVTHDVERGMALADRAVVLGQGRVVLDRRLGEDVTVSELEEASLRGGLAVVQAAR